MAHGLSDPQPVLSWAPVYRLNSKFCKLIAALRLCPFAHECMVYSGFRVRSFGVISAWCDLDQKICLDHDASKEPV